MTQNLPQARGAQQILQEIVQANVTPGGRLFGQHSPDGQTTSLSLTAPTATVLRFAAACGMIYESRPAGADQQFWKQGRQSATTGAGTSEQRSQQPPAAAAETDGMAANGTTGQDFTAAPTGGTEVQPHLADKASGQRKGRVGRPRKQAQATT